MLVMRERVPGLVVLGASLIGSGCAQVTQRIHEVSRVSVLLLCPETSGGHVAGALRAGADDHVSSKIDNDEFEARVLALLRRSRAASYTEAEAIAVGALRIDCQEAVCAVDGVEAKLPPNQLKLLRVLASRPGRLISYDELISAVWGSPYYAGHENLRKLVQRLRGTLAEMPDSGVVLASVARFGYRLEVPVDVKG
jgi:DNA-binding response OmpR family regulator